MNFLIETSARHIHLSVEDLNVLFGNGYELTKKKDLSQPGQYACAEKVKVVGSRSTMDITILGPVRKATQLEVSLTDARTLGVSAPIRESGSIDNTPGIKLIGPKGEVEITEGVIVAKRHIHMTTEDAANFGVSNGDIVKVLLKSDERETVYGDTVIRVSDSFKLAMHIDTDEANGAGLTGTSIGSLVK